MYLVMYIKQDLNGWPCWHQYGVRQGLDQAKAMAAACSKKHSNASIIDGKEIASWEAGEQVKTGSTTPIAIRPWNDRHVQDGAKQQ